MGTSRSPSRQHTKKRSSLSSSPALERPHRPKPESVSDAVRGRRFPSRLPSRHPAVAPTAGVPDADRELLQFNVRLAKNRQALLDTNRIECKAFREHARIENAAAAYARELGALLGASSTTTGLPVTASSSASAWFADGRNSRSR